jgi:hypothetical protein
MAYLFGLQNGDDFWVEGGGGDRDEGYGDRELEAAGACAARVEVEDVAAGFDGWIVGVAGDDGGDACGVGADIEIVDRVDEVEESAGDFDEFGRGEPSAGAVDVNVAADGGHRGDGAEGFKDLNVADVAGVE